MNKKVGSATILHLLIVSLVVFASLTLFARPAIAQDQASVSHNPCKCWIDVKTGKRVPTIPMGGGHYEDISPGNEFTKRQWVPDVSISALDPNRAFNSKTGQNYVREPNGGWIDIKTGKCVPTIPMGSGHYEDISPGNEFTKRQWVPDVSIGAVDPNRAFNSKTGQNYDLEACPATSTATTEPPPTQAPEPPRKPTPIFVRNYQPGEVFAGYMFLRAPGETAKNSSGFAVQMFYNFKPNLGIGGDLACAWGSGRLGTTIDVRLQRCTYTFGPQINTKPNGKVQFFFHPLVGGVHDANKTTAGTLISKSSANALALSIGGGFNVKMNSRVAVRPIQVDYQPTHFGGSWQSNWRFVSGIVIKFGKEK